VHELGTSRCLGTVRTEINRFHGRNLRDKNRLRKILRIRISGNRVRELIPILFNKTGEFP
jgi:hypothetical protein